MFLYARVQFMMMYWVSTVSDSIVRRSGVIFTTLDSRSLTTRFTAQI